MRYATAAAFRQALEDRLKTEAAATGLGVARLRKRVAFELLLHRLVAVAPNRWVLKGALALDFRFDATTRPTRDMDLGRADDEEAAIEDFAAAQQLALGDFFNFIVRRTDALDDADDFRAIRFHVTAELADRVFERFIVDVGFAASPSWTPDTVETSDLLSFAGIERIRVPALPLSQHLAEKVHAYTRKYGPSGRESTRPKDLVDILLIARSAPMEADALQRALEATFGQRELQPLPDSLPPPPANWREQYRRLAIEVDVEPELDEAFASAAEYLDPILAGRTEGEWDPRNRSWG
ncbi:MAG: nucleotidyl transferase AbiEii/AbiGii toxin family protein [Actinobacteria bacterium]|nr:nucleotidyl transferase AbiEii/AbiGii toxin family protein [Actinomycetota bacterium]